MKDLWTKRLQELCTAIYSCEMSFQTFSALLHKHHLSIFQRQKYQENLKRLRAQWDPLSGWSLTCVQLINLSSIGHESIVCIVHVMSKRM